MAASDFGRQAQCSRGSVDESVTYYVAAMDVRHVACTRGEFRLYGVVSSAIILASSAIHTLATMP